MPKSPLFHQPTLVTGAAGFVGSQVVAGLVAQKADVHVLVRPSSQLWRLEEFLTHPNVHLHQQDLLDGTGLKTTLAKIQPQYIFHLAASGAYHWQNDPQQIFQTNVLGTLQLFQALETVPYQLLVNVGSSSEYGLKTTPMKETDSLAPTSYYAVAKAAQTLLALQQAQTKPVVGVRLFSVYGPKEEPGKLIPTLFKAATTQEPLQLADPKSAHDYVFVGDVVKALLSVTQLKKHTGQVFNLGSGQQTTLQMVVELVRSLTHQDLQATWGTYPNYRWDTRVWVADASQTDRLLGWRAETTLRDGLAQTWKWYQEMGYGSV